MLHVKDKKFRPLIKLADTGEKLIKEDVIKYSESSREKYKEMNHQIEMITAKFHSLHKLADEVAEKYEKTARIRESSNPDDVMILQAILDHNLSQKDIELFCCYIARMFNIIFKAIQNASPRFASIKTIPRLHKFKAKDRELCLTYDNIAKQLGVTNDGKRNSDIYQLYEFFKDFDQTNKKRIFPHEIKPLKSYSSTNGIDTENSNKDLSTSSTNINKETAEKYLEMPATNDLLDLNLIAYAKAKIQVGVQNRILNNALVNCLRAVQGSKSIHSS